MESHEPSEDYFTRFRIASFGGVDRLQWIDQQFVVVYALQDMKRLMSEFEYQISTSSITEIKCDLLLNSDKKGEFETTVHPDPEIARRYHMVDFALDAPHRLAQWQLNSKFSVDEWWNSPVTHRHLLLSIRCSVRPDLGIEIFDSVVTEVIN